MSFQDAMKNKKWKDAMNEEINEIMKNDTWEIDILPKGHKVIGIN